jgi:hypothetical protein
VPGLRKEPAGKSSKLPEIPESNPAQADPAKLTGGVPQFPEAAEFQKNAVTGTGSLLVGKIATPDVGGAAAVIVKVMLIDSWRSWGTEGVV